MALLAPQRLRRGLLSRMMLLMDEVEGPALHRERVTGRQLARRGWYFLALCCAEGGAELREFRSVHRIANDRHRIVRDLIEGAGAVIVDVATRRRSKRLAEVRARSMQRAVAIGERQPQVDPQAAAGIVVE